MKLLITSFGLAVLTYVIQNKFAAEEKEGEKDSGPTQTFYWLNRGETKSFTPNTYNSIFLNTEKLNLLVLPDHNFVTKNNTHLTGSITNEKKSMKTAAGMIGNSAPKHSDAYHLFPAVNFLFVSLNMAN